VSDTNFPFLEEEIHDNGHQNVQRGVDVGSNRNRAGNGLGRNGHRSTKVGARQVITELVQLNDGQPYEYSRDELIAMLDEILQK
jgi:hypothetical protein